MSYDKYENMTGLEKSALLLNILGNEVTSQIFKKMKDNDVKRLISAMGSVSRVAISLVKQVLQEFYAEISETETLIFGQARGREFVLKTIGEERAKTILGQLSVVEGSRTLEALELVDSRTLANFLVNEHSQTVALIMAYLDPAKKCDVLKRLPEGLQTEVVLRLANLDFISPVLIAQVDEVLKQELATLGSIDTQQLGGIHPIAEMLNMMDKTAEETIITKVQEKNATLAEDIKKLMFVFEDIVYIDDRGLQTLLKDIPNDKLLIALKNADRSIKDKIFKNLSKRASDMLKDDLAALGPIRKSDVDNAQQFIIGIAKKLEAEGKIMISRGGEADALV